MTVPEINTLVISLTGLVTAVGAILHSVKGNRALHKRITKHERNTLAHSPFGPAPKDPASIASQPENEKDTSK